jgi:uncharacterized protein YecT (DUF1311 family)
VRIKLELEKDMLRITLLPLIFMVSAVFGGDDLERNCDPDYGLVDGACLEQAELDRDLLDVYEWVWSRSGGEQRLLLERSQRAWLEYRQATCDLMGARNEGISAGAREKCLEFIGRERTAELGLIRRITSMDEDACEAAVD